MPSAHGPIFYRRQKNRSENRFVCADFCSDIKSLRSFLGAAFDKKSVRVCWLQSDKNSEWRHPTIRPRLLLSHTIAPIKSRSVCAYFWSWLSPRKNWTFTPTFSRSSLRQKIVPCALGIRLSYSHVNVFVSVTSYRPIMLCIHQHL